MNTDDIRLFLKIYESHSISATAAALFQTQSSISRRLSLLEKELGTTLFLRGRGISEVVPSISGERFYPIASQMYALYNDALQLQTLCNRKRIRIAAPDSIASYALRPFFAELAGKRSDWEIEFIMSDSLPISRMTREMQVDIGIINGAAPFSDLQATSLFTEPYVVLASAQAYEEDTIETTQLNPAAEIYHLFGDEYARWHNFWFPEGLAKARVNLAHLAVELLSEDRDWTIVPLSVAKELCRNGLRIYTLKNTTPMRTATLISSMNANAEHRKLIEEFHFFWRSKTLNL